MEVGDKIPVQTPGDYRQPDGYSAMGTVVAIVDDAISEAVIVRVGEARYVLRLGPYGWDRAEDAP